MKKIILILLLLIPINVFAFSEYIIPGGRTIGIEVSNEGVLVVGFYRINNRTNRNELRVGDTIIAVNHESISTINQFV